MVSIDVKRIAKFVAGGQMVEINIVFQRRHVSSPLSPAESRGAAPRREHFRREAC